MRQLRAVARTPSFEPASSFHSFDRATPAGCQAKTSRPRTTTRSSSAASSASRSAPPWGACDRGSSPDSAWARRRHRPAGWPRSPPPAPRRFARPPGCRARTTPGAPRGASRRAASARPCSSARCFRTGHTLRRPRSPRRARRSRSSAIGTRREGPRLIPRSSAIWRVALTAGRAVPAPESPALSGPRRARDRAPPRGRGRSRPPSGTRSAAPRCPRRGRACGGRRHARVPRAGRARRRGRPARTCRSRGR